MPHEAHPGPASISGSPCSSFPLRLCLEQTKRVCAYMMLLSLMLTSAQSAPDTPSALPPTSMEVHKAPFQEESCLSTALRGSVHFRSRRDGRSVLEGASSEVGQRERHSVSLADLLRVGCRPLALEARSAWGFSSQTMQ